MMHSLYRSHDGRLARDLSPEQLKEALADERGVLWLDVQTSAGGEEELAGLLSDLFGFHPLALEDALTESHVPRVDDWGDYLYLTLHAATISPEQRLTFQEMDVFLGRNYLVTLHEQPVEPLQKLFERCAQTAERRLGPGPGRLLYELADAVVSGYMPVADGLDEEMDGIEDEVFRRPQPRLIRRIFRVRRSLLRLRREFGALREVMNRLARDDYRVIQDADRVYFRDVYDHLVRLYDIVEGLRDVVGGALDSYLGVTSNRINEVMRTLTVVTVLFLPLSFLSSFFGMNFFAEGFNVRNPFPAPALFWLCVALMLALPPAMLWWMHRRGMLRATAEGERKEKKKVQ